ncbi:MAG: acyl carrier protein [Nostoc sp. ChiSLP01]|nr:acyl carrier protein [Nostoc sp. CmiSLP01]MDZ8284682.1 acyl carrier protein [Nostoc sp. ChiSLP01]
MKDNQEKLVQAFCTALGIKSETVTDTLAYRSIQQWNSVAHMALVTELEKTFSIMLDTNDIIDMSSVDKAKQILSKYDVQF